MRSILSGNSRLPSPQSQQDPKEYVDHNADLPDSIRKATESEDESEAWMEAIRNEADYLDKHVWIPETSSPPERPQNTKLSDEESSNPHCVTFSPGSIFRYLQQTKHFKQNRTDDHLSNIHLRVYLRLRLYRMFEPRT